MDKKQEPISVTLDMPAALVKRIDKRAAELDRPRSWVIRDLCQKSLDENRAVESQGAAY